MYRGEGRCREDGCPEPRIVYPSGMAEGWCKSHYAAKRKHQTYAAQKEAATKRAEIGNCETCGSPFPILPPSLGGSRYCSNKCRANAPEQIARVRADHIELASWPPKKFGSTSFVKRPCRICNQMFVPVSTVNDICGEECRAEDARRQALAATRAAAAPPSTLVCRECNAEFVDVSFSDTGRMLRRDTYCSSKCSKKASKRARRKRIQAQFGSAHRHRVHLLWADYTGPEPMCDVCGTTDPGPKGWEIDHDHSCLNGGADRGCVECVRAVLCRNCNMVEGHLRAAISKGLITNLDAVLLLGPISCLFGPIEDTPFQRWRREREATEVAA